MQRVKFRKGQQRKFIKKVLERINCPSLMELRNRGFEIPYSTLKNYLNESRLLPKNLFEDLCYVSGIDSGKLNIKILEGNWGQVKGGERGKRK